MSVPIALRNLFESRTRFLISVGGVALAILLILTLDGIVAGSIEQVTIYIDQTPFDFVISQESVTNMHMTTSFFPSTKLDQIKRIAGVSRVTPILYATDYLASGENRSVAYIIGYKPGQPGGPWILSSGRKELKSGEIIIDEQIASKHGLSLGDKLTVLGREFTIAGLTKGTVTIVNSIAFVRFDDFERARNLRGAVSYAFVDVSKGSSPETVRARIKKEFTDVTVLSKETFAHNEQQVITDMSADIMRIMDFIGLLIGLAALGLTVYTATLVKLREYGVLKALGARGSRLFGLVFEQAFVSVGVGVIFAAAMAFVLREGLILAGTNILISFGFGSLLRVAIASLFIAVFASAIPIIRIAGVKPAEVFRR